MQHKFFKLFLPLALVILCLTGCSKDDDKGGDISQMVGTWQGVYDDNILTIHVNSDTSGYVEAIDMDDEDNGYVDYFTKSYIAEGGELMLMWEDDDEYDFEGYVQNITSKSLQYRYEDDEPWITLNKIG